MHGMIAFLRGKLVESIPHQAIVDVGGVGYLTNIPLTTFDRLPQIGGEVKLLTHHHVTEREHTLFGFFTNDERDLFRLLMDRVSGIGPKMALSVLSGMPVSAFKDAVIRNDTAALARIKGDDRKATVAALRMLAGCGIKEDAGRIKVLLSNEDNSIRVATINALRGMVDGDGPLEDISAFEAIETAKKWAGRI
jgi:Holliday junction DNA helicase RuvA subunit